MARAAALAFVLFSFIVGEAQATQLFRVSVVDQPLAAQPGGAIGLLVPGAGPDTSRAQALAALERGKVENSLRGGFPSGPKLIEITPASGQGPHIYVSLPAGGAQPNDRRYPVVVVGPGYHGILTSSSTRIPGLVSIADIAPTALGTEGKLGSRPDEDPVATLRALDERIDGHNDARLPASIVAALLILALALLWPEAGLLAFGAILGMNLLLGLAEVSDFWPIVVGIGLAAAGGGPLLALVLRSDLAVGLFLAGIVAAYLVVLGVDGSAVALSPFGPTQNARFYGISNLLETLLLVPALAGATYLWRIFGWTAFALVALAAFVAVAGNRFGADGGGAIVLAVGFAVLGVLLAELRGRRLVSALAGALALGAGLVLVDAAIGPSSHVTRAIRSGPDGLAADLRDRVELSWERIVHKPSVTVVVAIGLPLLVLLALRILLSDRPLALRALPLAFAAAIAVSLVVNDSPNDVVTAGLLGYVTVEAVMLRGRCAAPSSSPGSSPDSPSSLSPAAPPRP
jgi:hypothetical protein